MLQAQWFGHTYTDSENCNGTSKWVKIPFLTESKNINIRCSLDIGLGDDVNVNEPPAYRLNSVWLVKLIWTSEMNNANLLAVNYLVYYPTILLCFS